MYDTLIWTFIAFISGSVPWSLICVRTLSGQDVRRVGDGNPGATNAWISSGWMVGSISMLLDVLKAAVPVWLFTNQFLDTSYPEHFLSVTVVAISPIIGHAFPPFLRFRGGKALAPSWGSWIALTSGMAFPVAVLILGVMHLMQKNHAITVTTCLIGFIVIFSIIDTQALIFFGILNLLLVIFKHRSEYQHGIAFRGWIRT
jgi:glycerol-3-phosphate acyltransferase PlsY|tara:strand:- start:5842 stop:6444 length:603 start_codon:yes stop_codon:yes gene_type:complete